ncbi:MAG: hypothetical protein AB4041_22140 [Microcystaceae cyanobacterium]
MLLQWGLEIEGIGKVMIYWGEDYDNHENTLSNQSSTLLKLN